MIVITAIPRSGKTGFDRIEHGAVRVRVAAPPVEGAANAEIVKFLAGVCRIPRTTVRLLSGAASRHKRILLIGLDIEGAVPLLLTACKR